MIDHPGFVLEHCRRNCGKSAQDWSLLHQQLEQMLKNLDLLSHLQQKFPVIHYHHLPKISIAGCPNACSQPQIKDIGLTGFLMPKLTEARCTGCQACCRSCQEGALSWQGELEFEPVKCIGCGDCVRSCPTGKILPGESGWTLHLGGRLGRHPQLARLSREKLQTSELPLIIGRILEDYIDNGLPQERLTHFLDRRPHL